MEYDITTLIVVAIIIFLMFLTALGLLIAFNEKFRNLFFEFTYEIIYDILGIEGVIEDILCRSINTAGENLY